MSKQLKKVLILSYFFPPSNLAGSYRVYSWAKYIHKFGYFPVIVTRNWKQEMFIHEKNENFEVYYLPYKDNLREKIQLTFGNKKYVFFRKLLSLIELILQNRFNFIIPFRNIYSFSKKILENDHKKEFRWLIASGSPFILFKFCYLLNKKFNIHWIADYRDEWNTSQWKEESKYVWISRNFEKKWVKTSRFFITCSETWVKRISQFVHVKGYVVMNGYDENDFVNTPDIPKYSDFTILYVGTLYPSQPVEIFLNAFKKIIHESGNKMKIKLLFPGISSTPDQEARIKLSLKGYEQYYMLFERMEKKMVFEMMFKSHLLLVLPSLGVKGVHTSKLFEYIRSGIPVLLCPSDHDVIKELIEKTGTGFICNNEDEAFALLKKFFTEYRNGNQLYSIPDMIKIRQYSRENQAEILTRLMDQYVN